MADVIYNSFRRDIANGRINLASGSIKARGTVLYKDTGTPATSKLIEYIDSGSDKVSSNGNFTLQFDAEGILNFT